MAGPASSYCLFMVDADAMRLPKIIQRGLFADQPVATFSTTPGTDDFHNHLSLTWTVLTRDLQQESRRSTFMATQTKSKGKLSIAWEQLAFCCISVDGKCIDSDVF